MGISRKGGRARAAMLATAIGGLAALTAGSATATAAVEAPGLKLSVYTAQFQPRPNGPGPIGLGFLPDGRMLVASQQEKALFHIPAGGGKREKLPEWPADAAAGGIAFGPGGRTYVTAINQGRIVEIDPLTGRILRDVVTGLLCPVGLAVTADGNDMFVSSIHCVHGRRAGILRVHGPNTANPTLSDYGQVQTVDGLTIGPEGDLWAAHNDNEVLRIAGPSSPVAGAIHNRWPIAGADGVIVTPAAPGRPSYAWVVSTKGTLTLIYPEDPARAPRVAISGMNRGDFGTSDANGCLYVDQPRGIVKVTLADGTCPITLPEPGAQSMLPKKCSSRRVVHIRIRTWNDRRVRSARVFLDGNPVRVYRSGGRIRADVDLRGKPKGAYTIRIDATLSGGRTITGSRTYLTCTRKEPRQPPPL